MLGSPVFRGQSRWIWMSDGSAHRHQRDTSGVTFVADMAFVAPSGGFVAEDGATAVPAPINYLGASPS